MPRYRARLSASHEDAKPKSRYIWARDGLAAADQARDWLIYVRRTQPAARRLDTWELTAGNPPYTKLQIIAGGQIDAGE